MILRYTMEDDLLAEGKPLDTSVVLAFYNANRRIFESMFERPTMADETDRPLRFRVEISDVTKGDDSLEIVHAATVKCADHAELATYLRKTATLVDKHG